MKTMVHHDGALGDLLLSVPCLERMKASGPVHLVGRGDVVRFLKQTGAADEASSSDQALFSSLYTSPSPRLREFLSGFDRAFVFTADENASPSDGIRSIIPRTRTIRTVPGSSIHASAYRLSQLEPGTAAGIPHAMLDIPRDEVDAAGEALIKAGYRPDMHLIGLHPGSGGRAKCWPLERYFGLVRRLRQRTDTFVVLFTGEAEKGQVREAVSEFARAAANTLHAADLDLLSAAALLRQCGLYIGNDSGFSHVAALLGCPAIVLFGPTDAALWKPLGARVQVLSSPGCGPIAGIGVDETASHAERMMSPGPPALADFPFFLHPARSSSIMPP